jgi:hypothetical protein
MRPSFWRGFVWKERVQNEKKAKINLEEERSPERKV